MTAALLAPLLLLAPPVAEKKVELMGPPADSATVIPLWEGVVGGVPGGLIGDPPTLAVHVPADPNGTFVVVCPGGGYGTLATGHEGKDVAAWLNSLGVTAGVLRYRVSPNRHPAPLLDVQRAVRLVRSDAAKFGVNPAKIGVLGFSAGGHLAASAATLHTPETRTMNPLADADPLTAAVSARPDFAVLIYPVVTFTGGPAHAGSALNLLGADAGEELLEQFNLQRRVTAETPPTFLVHTGEDTGVPPANSVLFWEACRAANVPAELHVFETGRHGFGMGGPASESRGNLGPDWTGLCEAWLSGRGLIPGADGR